MSARTHLGFAGASICAAAALWRPQQVRAEETSVPRTREPQRLTVEAGVVGGKMPSAAPASALLGVHYESPVYGSKRLDTGLVGVLVVDPGFSVEAQLTRLQPERLTRLELSAPRLGLGIGEAHNTMQGQLIVGVAPRLSWAPPLDAIAAELAGFTGELGLRLHDVVSLHAAMDVGVGYATIRGYGKNTFNPTFGLELLFDLPFGTLRIGSTAHTAVQPGKKESAGMYTTVDTGVRLDIKDPRLSIAASHGFLIVAGMDAPEAHAHQWGLSLLYRPFERVPAPE